MVVVPIGFISDHIEVLYDLDTEATRNVRRAWRKHDPRRHVGTHPRFVRMIRELIVERMAGDADRPTLGELGASHNVCPEDCCLRCRVQSAKCSNDGSLPHFAFCICILFPFDNHRHRIAAPQTERGQSATQFLLRSAYSRVTNTRAPLAPIGCPKAIAPPLTLVLAGSSLRGRMQAR